MAEDTITRGDLEALRGELKDVIHSVRTELKDEITTTRLDVAHLRSEMNERFGTLQADMNERFGTLQAEMADTRKELAVLQVDIRKDLSTFTLRQDQMRQEMRDLRQTMERWQATTTRQLWTMVSVVSGAVIVGILKLVFFPGP